MLHINFRYILLLTTIFSIKTDILLSMRGDFRGTEVNLAMPNIQLSKNLRTLRKAHHLTQTHLSEILNISRQAYSNYENNKRTPDLDSLIHLSQLYQVSLDQLVNFNIFSKIKKGIIPVVSAMDIAAKNTLYLTDSETNLVMKFRDLPFNSQKVVLGFLDSQVAHK